MMPNAIRISHLFVSYTRKTGKTEAIQDLSLELPEGGIYSIVGPSGCGKSTLLHVLSGIIKDYTGEILINGKAPDPKFHSIGLVPQNYGLLPWMQVKDNICLAAKIRHTPTNKAYNEDIIRTLELGDLLSRYPKELSGGQRQRVALARSFIQKPYLLLMDEPFSALDAFTADKCRKLFLEIWKKHKVTTIFVTHHLEEAVRLGKQIIILSSSPGKVRQIITNPLTLKGADRSREAYFRQTEEIKNILKGDEL